MVSNKEQSRLSGSYVRSLVKQIAYSSRSKDAMNKPKDAATRKAQSPENNMTSANSGDGSGKSSKISQSQSQTHKKQVRRRLHTSRPYQERLLNMAEARREIVTALKQHRAAMKQASEQQKLLQQQSENGALGPGPLRVLQTQSLLEQEEMSSKSKPNPINNFLDPNNYLDPFSCPNFPPPPLPPPSDPLSWPLSNAPNATAFNFVLPNQPLGLNLNFQDFNNIIETSPFQHNPPILYSSPPSSSTSTSSPGDDLHPPQAAVSRPSSSGGGLHAAVDEEEMAEIRTMGDKHEMEWNDTVNVVTSAWWLEFLKTVESPAEVDGGDDVFRRALDDVMEFPAWLNPKEDYLMQPCLSDYSSSDDHLHDPALSCMEIGEIEEMDEDWLA